MLTASELKAVVEPVKVIGEYVRLKKSGKNWIGCCPFHEDKNPSFSLNPESELWYCHACGIGGDILTFVEKAEGRIVPDRKNRKRSEIREDDRIELVGKGNPGVRTQNHDTCEQIRVQDARQPGCIASGAPPSIRAWRGSVAKVGSESIIS